MDDARRLGTGLLFSAQLAVDTTPVSARRTDGSARRRAAQVGRRSSSPTKCENLTWSDLTAEFTSWFWRSKWRGRWSRETQAFNTQLARAQACSETQLMGRQAWRLRWGSLIGVCCGSGCGFFHVGAAECSRLRLRHTSATGCGAGVAFRWSGWVSLAHCGVGVRFDVHAILPLLCDSFNRLLCSCLL